MRVTEAKVSEAARNTKQYYETTVAQRLANKGHVIDAHTKANMLAQLDTMRDVLPDFDDPAEFLADIIVSAKGNARTKPHIRAVETDIYEHFSSGAWFIKPGERESAWP